jgi:hypothetical protein
VGEDHGKRSLQKQYSEELKSAVYLTAWMEEAGNGDSECKSVGSNEARWKL